MDEQWSFVGKKKNQRWLWYAWEPRYKRVIAHAFGKRDIDAFKELQRLLSKFTIPFYCTDDYGVYSANLPIEKHIIGKRYTQRIERTNLTLRSHLKRLVRKQLDFRGRKRCTIRLSAPLLNESTTINQQVGVMTYKTYDLGLFNSLPSVNDIVLTPLSHALLKKPCNHCSSMLSLNEQYKEIPSSEKASVSIISIKLSVCRTI